MPANSSYCQLTTELRRKEEQILVLKERGLTVSQAAKGPPKY